MLVLVTRWADGNVLHFCVRDYLHFIVLLGSNSTASTHPTSLRISYVNDFVQVHDEERANFAARAPRLVVVRKGLNEVLIQ